MPNRNGAGDRDRTGDIQLGKLAFYVRKAMPPLCVFSVFRVIAYVQPIAV